MENIRQMTATKFLNNPLWTKDKIKEVESIIDYYTRTHTYELNSIISTISCSPEDFKQEILAKLCRQKGYQNFDPNIKSFKRYILLICKRHQGDMVRRKHRLSSVPDDIKVSINAELNEDGFSINDILSDKTSINFNIIKDMIDNMPDEPIELTAKTIDNLTYRELFILLMNKDIKDIALTYNILQKDVKEAINDMIDYIKYNKLGVNL